MSPGDVFFLYTDGVTESMNADAVEFGDAELREVLAEAAGSSAAGVSRHVVKAVQEHSGDAPQSDDITCLALRYLGRK